MNLPFNTEQFLNIFKIYNESIFPAQIVGYIVAIGIVFLITKNSKIKDKAVHITLSIFWLWMGVFYHLVNFTSINPAAYIFGVMFIIQSLFLLFSINSKMDFNFDKSLKGILGIILICYSMLIYPLLGIISGHIYPYSPVFGVTPCPTTIFTFGIFLLAKERIKFRIFIIPLIWSFIGFTAAINLGIYEDIGLLISSIITLVVFFVYRRK